MKTALIGHTGFVGGNLARQFAFDDLYRRANIESIAGEEYDLIVCCGAPGAKWLANKDPQADREAINRLIAALHSAKAETFILISTVDVYPSPVEVDENRLIDLDEAHPYGRHRLLLEHFAHIRFPNVCIVRLPGLFGQGLKKNAIYDLLNNNEVEKINGGSVFQFYDVGRLWADIGRIRESGLRLVNWATEPVRMDEAVKAAFGYDFDQVLDNPARYDMRTIHAGRFGKSGPYIYSKDEVLADLRRFVDESRNQPK